MKPKFFAKESLFRKWLDKNHYKKEELWVGYYKVASGLPSMTWSLSVDQALCYGWIDGIRKSVDEKSYMIRFTPRKPKSKWSAVNINKAAELIEKGLMQPTGIAAFERRDEKNSKIYSFAQKSKKLGKKYELEFKKNKKARDYFEASAPSYKKLTTQWIVSAKKEETRLRRLRILIEHCAKEERIPQVDWKKKSRSR